MKTPTKTEPPTSFVRCNRDGSVDYIGALATKLYQGQCLRAALSTPLGPFSNRGLLTIAQAFTGHRYGPEERLRALSELDDWIRTYEMLVPIFEETA